MENLPEAIQLYNLPPTTFKLNKYGDYVNAIDESLKYEVSCYNDYLKSIGNDIQLIGKIYKGEVDLTRDYYELIFDVCNGQLPEKWKSSCFNYSKYKQQKISLNKWNEELTNRIDTLKKWLISPLTVYPINLFYSSRLFLFSILIHFSRKAGVSPEKLKLKFFLTNFYSSEELQASKSLVEKIISDNGGKDCVFCSGFTIENAEIEMKQLSLVNCNERESNGLCPIIAISYGENEVNPVDQNIPEEENNLSVELDSSTPNFRNINIPIYGRVDSVTFSHLEAIGYVDVKFDDTLYKEDFWITKGVMITPDF